MHGPYERSLCANQLSSLESSVRDNIATETRVGLDLQAPPIKGRIAGAARLWVHQRPLSAARAIARQAKQAMMMRALICR